MVDRNCEIINFGDEIGKKGHEHSFYREKGFLKAVGFFKGG